MAAAIARTASATAGVSRSAPEEIAPTLRAYCNDAASTSSWVAGGSRPRSMVMFLHMAHGTPPTTTPSRIVGLCIGVGVVDAA